MTTIAERSPSHAPWEKHPTDARRTVGSVLDGHVIAATTDAGLGVALTKAVLTCGDSRGSLPENLSGPGAVAAARDLDETCKEVTP